MSHGYASMSAEMSTTDPLERSTAGSLRHRKAAAPASGLRAASRTAAVIVATVLSFRMGSLQFRSAERANERNEPYNHSAIR
jgi:hypothetical protein